MARAVEQVVSRGAPEQRYATDDFGGEREGPLFSRYRLRARLGAGADDECYLAVLEGPVGFEKPAFLRRFLPARLDAPMIEALKRQGHASVRGVAQLFELGTVDGWSFVVHEYVNGVSLVELPRISWQAALVLAFDAAMALSQLLELGIDPALTSRRIRLSLDGEIVLCPGLPAYQSPTRHRALCSILEPILSLAANAEERALIHALFVDDDPGSVWVASDALVERHPELDPLLPIVFLALAGRVDSDAARAALVAQVPIERLRQLWDTVIHVVQARGR